MIKVGFIGRTKMLYDAICCFNASDEYEIAFIWTCREEEYYGCSSDDFRTLASSIGVKFISSSCIADHFNEVDADVVVSINFVNIITKDFIDKFTYGIINAHAGDLPRYRGNACANWAIINSEKEVVLTFHLMSAELDEGPIIRKLKFSLRADTYIGDVYDWLHLVVPAGFKDSVARLVKGEKLIPQIGRPMRSFPRKPEDSRLDFSRSLSWNYRLIRASSRPFSGAYAHLNGTEQRVHIFSAEPYCLPYDFHAVSGQILERSPEDHSFLVAVQGSVLRVYDYSLDGLSLEASFGHVCGSLRNRLT